MHGDRPAPPSGRPAPLPPVVRALSCLGAAALTAVLSSACGSASSAIGGAHPIPTFAPGPPVTPAKPVDVDPIRLTPTTMPSWQHNHASTPEAAAGIVHAHGYDPLPGSAYAPTGLRAVVGGHTGGDPADQRVFFFQDGNFLGTDAGDASMSIAIGQTDPETITVTYALFHSTDAAAPTGGAAAVRFHWDKDHLQPLDPLPVSDPHADGSRR